MPRITTARQTGARGNPGPVAPPAVGPVLAPDGGAVKATAAPAAAAPLVPITLRVKAARPAPQKRGRAGAAGAAVVAVSPVRHAHAHAKAAVAPVAAPVRIIATTRTPSSDPGPTGVYGVAAAQAVALATGSDPEHALETVARAMASRLVAKYAMLVRPCLTHPGRVGAPAASRVAKALHGAPDRA